MRVLVKKIRTLPLPRLLSAGAPPLIFLMAKVVVAVVVVVDLVEEVEEGAEVAEVEEVVEVVEGLEMFCKIPLCICKRGGASSGGF